MSWHYLVYQYHMEMWYKYQAGPKDWHMFGDFDTWQNIRLTTWLVDEIYVLLKTAMSTIKKDKIDNRLTDGRFEFQWKDLNEFAENDFAPWRGTWIHIQMKIKPGDIIT